MGNLIYLVVGGSQGANIFDGNLKNQLLIFLRKFQLKLFHQTSEKNIPIYKNFYSKNNIENIIFSFKKLLYYYTIYNQIFVLLEVVHQL